LLLIITSLTLLYKSIKYVFAISGWQRLKTSFTV
jgi:hypothetical protein